MQNAPNQKALSIYLNCMEEAKHRIAAAEMYCAGVTSQPILDTESSCLQLRKTLELVAYASIAPHKSKYAKWRAESPKNPSDYSKDYNGRAILTSLKAINPYSYPRPLSPRVKTENGWHYPKFQGDCLTKKKYERLYDKCSALLHADNPWGNKKFYDQFRQNIPRYVALVRSLLNVHSIIIQHDGGTSAVIIEFGDMSMKAKGYIGSSQGDTHLSEDYYS